MDRAGSGSVIEFLTRDRGATGSSLTGITALCPWARHINPSIVLVQPRKTHPFIIERLLMGRKNQIKQIFLSGGSVVVDSLFIGAAFLGGLCLEFF